METPKEYYYTYYSYEEWGRGYFGSRGCKCLPEKDVKYFGSFCDKTFRPTQKIILKDDYTTRAEAYADEIILHDYYDVANNPHFANRAKQTTILFSISKERMKEVNDKLYREKKGIHSLSKERKSELGRKNAKYNVENCIGIHGRTKEQRSEDSKKGGKRVKELGVGIYALTSEQLVKNGKKLYELGIGIHSLSKEERGEIAKKLYKEGKGLGSISKEQRSENSKINYKKGLEKLTKEQRSESAKKAASQKWMCLETSHISNAGGLTSYQRARGIDTSLRERIS
jgi:hypothetical protein